jgi:hypothetical protein
MRQVRLRGLNGFFSQSVREPHGARPCTFLDLARITASKWNSQHDSIISRKVGGPGLVLVRSEALITDLNQTGLTILLG